MRARPRWCKAASWAQCWGKCVADVSYIESELGGQEPVSIGLVSASSPTTGVVGMKTYSVTSGTQTPAWANSPRIPPWGITTPPPLNTRLLPGGASTWYGDNNTPTITQAGLSGQILG